VTSVVVPPDADPPLDEPELADRLVHRAKEIGKARVLPLGALTLGLNGERLAELAGLKKAGCVAFSQAKASRWWIPKPCCAPWSTPPPSALPSGCNRRIYWLSRNGIAHEGEVASRLGLAGIPVAAETIAIATIVQLVRDTGCRVHLTRLSSAAGVALVKAARDEGLPVTCDIGVHHLLLTENDIGFFNPHARFCPPLRAQNDRLALSTAAASGLAAICSDHTPVACRRQAAALRRSQSRAPPASKSCCR
jgi:dihydroorotase